MKKEITIFILLVGVLVLFFISPISPSPTKQRPNLESGITKTRLKIRSSHNLSRSPFSFSPSRKIKKIYLKKIYLGLFTVTAYSRSQREGTIRGITATGLLVDKGVVAVDPKVIPLGSLVLVEGYGYAIAADTGKTIKGKRLDIFFHEKKECYKWGVRKKKVYLISYQY